MGIYNPHTERNYQIRKVKPTLDPALSLLVKEEDSQELDLGRSEDSVSRSLRSMPASLLRKQVL
jgi:hypothetical protein